MDELLKLCATYGFPAVVALYLLTRVDARLGELTTAVTKLSAVVDALEVLQKNATR